MQYFSFVTLTTTGYGDYTAAGDGARALATIEAMIGQIFLATLVARLVSSFARGTRRLRSDRADPTSDQHRHGNPDGGPDGDAQVNSPDDAG